LRSWSFRQGLQAMRVFFIQPGLTKYRVPVVQSLAEKHDVTVFARSRRAAQIGLDPSVPCWMSHVEADAFGLLGGRLFFQRRVVSAILLHRPDAVIIFANLRFLSYWLALLVCRLMRIRVYSHGHGLYSEETPSRTKRVLFRTACRLSTKYICYAEICRRSLVQAGCDESRLVVADNSLHLDQVVQPNEKTYLEKGILFLGRLRSRSGLELLVQAVEALRCDGKDVELHVIGDGEHAGQLRGTYAHHPWVIWHGAVHDDLRIADISRSCRIGCYPGDAGLSIVHFFGLSLPTVIHNISIRHGPEASYLREGENGLVYRKTGGVLALAQTLADVWALDTGNVRHLGESAFATYTRLNTPPLGQRFLEILESHGHSE
jgi:glycosyltransferase involved in cell wall biosynthesis